MVDAMNYVVFTDESSITASRYRSQCALSLPLDSYDEMSTAIRAIVQEHGLHEFKWRKLRNDRHLRCAEQLVNCILDNLYECDIRVDTIMWDTQDSRHTICGRDDLANDQRMLFHLLRNSMKRRPRGSTWHIRPDARYGIDWATIRECLSAVGRKRELKNTVFGRFFDDPYFNIESFEERSSDTEVLIQVADLFSGLFVFSCSSYDRYCAWASRKLASLFALGGEDKLSTSERFRCELLQLFITKCKQRKLGVSLDRECRLCTYDPQKPMNFWLYQPQGGYDRAPTKERVR